MKWIKKMMDMISMHLGTNDYNLSIRESIESF